MSPLFANSATETIVMANEVTATKFFNGAKENAPTKSNLVGGVLKVLKRIDIPNVPKLSPEIPGITFTISTSAAVVWVAGVPPTIPTLSAANMLPMKAISSRSPTITPSFLFDQSPHQISQARLETESILSLSTPSNTRTGRHFRHDPRASRLESIHEKSSKERGRQDAS